MNKRQRKKYAKKHGSPGLQSLIVATRKTISKKAIRDYTHAAVNDAWQKFHKFLADSRAMEMERIMNGPMTWVGPNPLGYFAVADQSEVVTEADLERWSKAGGPHAAAGKEE